MSDTSATGPYTCNYIELYHFLKMILLILIGQHSCRVWCQLCYFILCGLSVLRLGFEILINLFFDVNLI